MLGQVEGISVTVRKLYEEVFFVVTGSDGRQTRLKIKRGVRQGGPESSLLFVIAYALDLAKGKEERVMTNAWWTTTKIKLPDMERLGFVTMSGEDGAQEIDVSELGYVDDLLGLYPFRDLSEIAELTLQWTSVFESNGRKLQLGKMEIVIR